MNEKTGRAVTEQEWRERISRFWAALDHVAEEPVEVVRAHRELLNAVEWEALSEAERRAHTAEELLGEALWSCLQEHEERLRRVEEALASLGRRDEVNINALEDTPRA